MPELTRNILEVAYQWHARSVDNDLSLEEHTELALWLDADPAHQAAFDRANRLWQKLDQVPREAADTNNTRTADTAVVVKAQNHNGKPKPWLSIQGLLGIAAGFAAIALVSLFLFRESSTQLKPIEHRTAIAEHRDIELADGTVVNLGPRSRIEVSFTNEDRSVSLFSGQAYFDVAHDPEKPFEVLVGPMSATVVGTEFVAEKSDHSSRISVSEGRVKIAPLNTASSIPTRELAQGSQIRVSRSGETVYSEMDPGLIGSWRSGQWVFSNTRLSDVIADANRYSDRPIEILDPRIGAMTVSLSLAAGDVEALLDNLALAFPVRVRRQGDGAIVITARYE